MRLLFIHGIAQGGKNPVDLAHTWTETLKKGFEAAKIPFTDNLTIDFPYYGDALDARVANSLLPLPAAASLKGTGSDPEYEKFIRNSLKEIQVNARIPDEEIALEAGDQAVAEKGIQNWLLTLALARIIDRRLSPLTSFTIEKFLRDVYLYTSDPNTAREINEIVSAKLTDEPTIIVAHSLGTVVAYRVLQERKDLNLRRFITVGSPLGIKAISSRLGVIKYPTAELTWFNGYDTRDIVGLNPLKDPFFKTEPAIINYNGIRNQTDNRHGIIGYLNDATVAKNVSDAFAL